MADHEADDLKLPPYRDDAGSAPPYALNQSERIVRALPFAHVLIDVHGAISAWTAQAETLLGWTASEAIGRPLSFLLPSEGDGARVFPETVAQGTATAIDVALRRKDGPPLEATIWARRLPERNGGLVLVVADLAERRGFEERVRLVQKVDAIGHLAGGVAHDFNNLLTIINGYSNLLLTNMEPDDPGRTFLEEIQKAGERAGQLTGQLLAFGRRQLLQPKVLDLNQVVSRMENLVRRLIGKNIELRVERASHPQLIKADPAQIEQVVANLAANARDAMPKGGVLTIATQDVSVDASTAATLPGMKAGRYVLLSVRDSGVGMDEARRARLFEPFYTTKTLGQGSGLGLATVYGIVKQSGGFIYVTSQPGQGTRFDVYLAVVEDSEVRLATAPGYTDLPRGSEVVLLVEEEQGIRDLAQQILSLSGYTVLEAKSGVEALQIASQQRGPIHVVVVDLDLPHFNARDLAIRLGRDRIGLKVLLLGNSGGPVGSVARESGEPLLAKPYTPFALARKVREVLDS